LRGWGGALFIGEIWGLTTSLLPGVKGGKGIGRPLAGEVRGAFIQRTKGILTRRGWEIFLKGKRKI